MANLALQQLPDELSCLREIALDLRWTWSHEADALWERIAPKLWEQTRSPWTILQYVSLERLQALAKDPEFVGEVNALNERRRNHRERPTWFSRGYGGGKLGKVAYFSMEFGLGAALPLYAGGLGVLAGDFLKASSDLGVPVVGVGLLYQEGYFRQTVDADGVQHEAYPYNEPDTLPIEPALVGGAWLRVPISLPGRIMSLRVWQATVGRATLYLLDSNDLLNTPADRGVTGKLYGGDVEMRLMQDLVLGVGGWRALEALGHEIEVCHINEGHGAFAVIERARRLAARSNLDFRQALWATRAGNVFTSHTPVEAGFDRFPPELLHKHLTPIEDGLQAMGSSSKDLLALGRINADDEAEPFNMAYLAMRGSGACLGVSRLHGEVSHRLFQPLFPRWPEHETPVGHITNGVHTPTWDSAEADRLWTEACGQDRWRAFTDELPDQILAVSDEQIWALRGQSRQVLVRNVRHRLAAQLRARGLNPDIVKAAESVFDPNVLTLGFARRFTEYKRPTLLLQDEERLARILANQNRPVQIVVAGKAHPQDAVGKDMVRQWIALARSPRFRRRVVFLEDYDLALAQELVQGVDVWINTPRRPWEACGTSGMKVLVNGGLNCSVQDGWWDEAYSPDLGWSIGVGHDGQASTLDAKEAEIAYDLIEQQIAPEFYDRDATGLPRAWVARIRRSMSVLTSAFSSARMVRDYVEKAYLPASARLKRRAQNDFAVAKDLADWSARLQRHWPGLHIGAPTVSRADDSWRFSVPVFLGDALPADVRVELYAEPSGRTAAEVTPLVREQPVSGSTNGYVYAGQVAALRPSTDYTVRVVPSREDAITPLELPLICWQR